MQQACVRTFCDFFEPRMCVLFGVEHTLLPFVFDYFGTLVITLS